MQSNRIVRFGAFEVDLDRAELRKRGLRMRLQEQPSQVLILLLERPGEVISREELIGRLWPDGTIVDFDRGLNAAVTRLRQALSDTPDAPRYIETIARRGYRFVGSVEALPAAAEPVAPLLAAPRPGPRVPGGRKLVWLAAIFGPMLVLSGGWIALHRTRPPDAGASLKVTRLTAGEGLEWNASFSPEGTQVVYEWEQEDGQRHLYLKAVGPGDAVPLTFGPAADYGPVWSPDGRLIAFLRQTEPSKVALFVIPPIGGVPHKVTETLSPPLWVLLRWYRRLDWTRDSRHIVLSAPERAGDFEALVLIDINTGEKTWLTKASADSTSANREPAVSPDGLRIVFTRGNMGGNEALYVLPLSSDLRPNGAARPIPNASGSRCAAWMPDGRRIIFTTLAPGQINGFALSSMDVESGRKYGPLVALGRSATLPALSPGGRLVYSVVAIEGNIWRQEIPSARKPAAPPVKLIASAALNLHPQYSPDGLRIAFASDRFGAREIWTCGSDGSRCAQVTSFNGPFFSDFPRWSPDSKQLIFESLAGGQPDVYTVDANGGVPRRVNPEGPHGRFSSWSHDGKWIYFSSFDAQPSQIWRVPATGGKAVQLTRAGGRVAFESPDSQTLYYTKDELKSKLFRSKVDGSGETEILSGVDHGNFAVVTDGVYYLQNLSEDAAVIRRFLFATGEDSAVASIAMRGHRIGTPGFSLSPDGKAVIFSDWRRRGNLMLAENFF